MGFIKPQFVGLEADLLMKPMEAGQALFQGDPFCCHQVRTVRYFCCSCCEDRVPLGAVHWEMMGEPGKQGGVQSHMAESFEDLFSGLSV